MGQSYSLQPLPPGAPLDSSSVGTISINIPPGNLQGNLEDGLNVNMAIPLNSGLNLRGVQRNRPSRSPSSLRRRSPSVSMSLEQTNLLNLTPMSSRSVRAGQTTPQARKSPRRSTGRVSRRTRSTRARSRSTSYRRQTPREQRIRRRAINFNELQDDNAFRSRPLSLSPPIQASNLDLPQEIRSLPSPNPEFPTLSSPKATNPRVLVQNTPNSNQLTQEVDVVRRFYYFRNSDLDTLRKIIQKMMADNENGNSSGSTNFKNDLNRWLDTQM